MIWSMQRLRTSFQLIPAVFKKAALILVPISLLVWGVKYSMSTLHHMRFQNPMDFSMPFVVGTGVGALIIDTVLALISFFVLTRATVFAMQRLKISENHPGPLSLFQHLFIEDLRRTLSIILWSFAFLIPGIVRWVRLTFVGHVAILNPSYSQGKVDALARSSKTVEGRGFPILMLLLCFFGLSVILETLGSEFENFSVPLIIFYSLSWLTSLVFGIYLTLTYFELDPEIKETSSGAAQ